MDFARIDVDVVDRGLHELDADAKLPFARTHDVFGVRQPERHEQQARLVDVTVVLIDHSDDRVVEFVQTAQTIRGQRAARSAAEDHNSPRHTPKVPVRAHMR